MTISKQAKTALAGWLLGLVLGAAWFGYLSSFEVKPELKSAIAACEELLKKLATEDTLAPSAATSDRQRVRNLLARLAGCDPSSLSRVDEEKLLPEQIAVKRLSQGVEYYGDRRIASVAVASAVGLIFSIPWLWQWFLRRARELSAAIRGED